MKIISVPTSEITNWESFHDVMLRALKLPDFYGKNMDALIDCLTDAGEPETGMCGVAEPGGICLHLSDARELKARCQDVFESLVELVAFVNYRRIEVGEGPVLMLSYDV